MSKDTKPIAEMIIDGLIEDGIIPEGDTLVRGYIADAAKMLDDLVRSRIMAKSVEWGKMNTQMHEYCNKFSLGKPGDTAWELAIADAYKQREVIPKLLDALEAVKDCENHSGEGWVNLAKLRVAMEKVKAALREAVSND